MTNDQLLRMRTGRAVHHINAIQRLLELRVLALMCCDDDGRPVLVANPAITVDNLQDVAAAFACGPLDEFIQ